jgi:lysophospholipase L1-like esterase
MWPVSTVRGSWAIALARGLDSRHPSALVVELGANDSLRATFADVLGKPQLAAQIRAAVATNISELLAESARLGLPTVLVTVPTFPTTDFGGGVRYEREAQLVNSIIRSAATAATATAAAAAAARPGDRVIVADWATLSGPHHLADPSTASWFTADGLHPNPVGEAALVGLVRSATDQFIRPARP